MRKFLILGIALVLGGAALLIPAGAQGAPPNAKFTASVSSEISVACDGGSTGTATYTVTATQDSGGAGQTSGNADRIDVYRGSTLVASLSNFGSTEVTDTTMPCTDDPTTVTFTFTPMKGTSTSGKSTTATATVTPTDEGS